MSSFGIGDGSFSEKEPSPIRKKFFIPIAKFKKKYYNIEVD